MEIGQPGAIGVLVQSRVDQELLHDLGNVVIPRLHLAAIPVQGLTTKSLFVRLGSFVQVRTVIASNDEARLNVEKCTTF